MKKISDRERNKLRNEIEKKLLRIENQYGIKILDWNFLLGGKNGIWNPIQWKCPERINRWSKDKSWSIKKFRNSEVEWGNVKEYGGDVDMDTIEVYEAGDK